MRAAIGSLAAVLALTALAGCGVVRTNAPAALPGSPASQGATSTPYVASEEWGSHQVPVAGRVEPAPKGAYLGVYAPPSPFNLDAIDAYTKLSGRHVSIVMWYQPWALTRRQIFDPAACLAIMRRGAVPMITWEPWDPGNDANALKDPANQPSFNLKAIAGGDFDAYIRDWARAIKHLGGPVMLRPMHEMNGTWYPWGGTVNGNTPATYVKAWRRIHAIFQAEGATNVTWVWSINGESVPNTLQNSYASYYPGDSYVDWTAISGFNWGTTDQANLGWKTFDQLYSTPLAYLTTLPKPICVAEMASVEKGGDKAAWLADTYAKIALREQIKAVVYYDSLEKRPRDTEDWQITSSPASLEAYRTAISAPYYVSTPPAALSDWANQLTGADWTYLSSLIPAY
jgi:hypothetical protein